MTTALRNITKIQVGLFTVPQREGNIMYLQSSHFDRSGNFLSGSNPNLFMDSRLTNYLLNDGCILLSSRGGKYFATIYHQKIVGPAIASNSFLVLQITQPNLCTPGYLNWYLNTDHIQNRLKHLAKGTNIKSISKGAIEELEIPLPPLEEQFAIFRLSQIEIARRNIVAQIEESKKKYTELSILNKIS